MRIGVLALQGAFLEHIRVLHQLGVEAVEVRLPAELEGLDGLIIPGGESTTIGKLALRYDLIGPLRRFAAAKPMWGTCAGMIFMARKIDSEQPRLAIMDIMVRRNAFGRQRESFTTDIYIDDLPEGALRPFPGIFIRAPKVTSTWGRARAMAALADGTPVAAREDRLLATAFHPELSTDDRFHRYFLELVSGRVQALGM